MGRALDIHIPLGLATGESTADLCPVVKVYFAEDVLPSGQVKVAVRPDAASGGTELHVSTFAVLNEPYARIDVIAGCTNQFSRQYTILTELPSLEAPKPVKVAQAVALPVSQVLSVQPVVTQGRARTPLGDGDQGAPASGKQIRVAKGAIPPAAKPVQRGARARDDAPVSPTGARLKLDSVELMASLAQLAPSLKLDADNFSGSEVALEPELAQRRAAARALWQAMNEAPEQVVANAAKADSSGVEGQGLKAQLAAARQAEADLQMSLNAEREGVYTHPLVLALGGGLLLALGGLAMLWRRKQTSEEEMKPWWKRSMGPSAAGKPPKTKNEPSALKAAMQKLVPAGKAPVDIDVDTLFPPDSELGDRHARRDPLKKKSAHGPTTIGGQDFLASTLMDGARSVATEELFDLQQQVEFFISLGQAEQAVDVLVNHLSDSHEPSPLAYLDLLRLYHDLDRRTDYEALRKDFNRLFSGAAPAFDEYSYSRRGLERYEAALSRIQSIWPKPAVLDVIERSIFRQSSTQDHEVFDLEAYRELLLLYGIAREIIAPENTMGAMGPSVAQPQAPGSTVLQPLVAQTRESRERENAVPLQSPVELNGDAMLDSFGAHGNSDHLDIDLSLDADLSTHNENLAVLPALAAAAVSPVADSDPMSFDLSDSLFDSLPEPGETAHTPIRYAGNLNSAPQMDDGASLDFSGLDDIDAFTIKKSGTKS